MKKNKIFIYIILLLIISILFYGINIIINNKISKEVNKIELSLENKQFIQNQKLNNDIIKLGYMINNVSGSPINYKENIKDKNLEKASKTLDKKYCENITDEKLKVSCINYLYYSIAQKDKNIEFCNKINDNDFDKNECIKKVESIKK